jgi:hypothetical protein
MSRSGQLSSNLLLALVRSYSQDLKHWLKGLTARYATGTGLLASGVVFLVIGAGIATSAAFHALDFYYGTYVAYGVVGGMFLLLGVSGLAAGRVMLSRPTTPLPTPKRQFQILKQSITAPAVAALVSQGGQRAGRIDPVSRGLAVGAAAILLGWIAANQLKRDPNSRRR